jgi:hypothetical protein
MMRVDRHPTMRSISRYLLSTNMKVRIDGVMIQVESCDFSFELGGIYAGVGSQRTSTTLYIGTVLISLLLFATHDAPRLHCLQWTGPSTVGRASADDTS